MLRITELFKLLKLLQVDSSKFFAIVSLSFLFSINEHDNIVQTIKTFYIPEQVNHDKYLYLYNITERDI